MEQPAFVLVTAARNEQENISRTIASVVSQSLRPVQWVIVSDASTDGTEEIVSLAAKDYGFIRLVRRTHNRTRSFAGQVDAIGAGVQCLRDLDYEFIGNLDADVSFDRSYYESLFARFCANPRLGLAGGVVREMDGTIIGPVGATPLISVSHATQMFRRACFEAIGGYRAVPHGGPDTVAEVMVRMIGWQVEAFPDLVVQHHRQTGSAGGVLRGRWRQGTMDFCLGYHPLFEIVKCARRIPERPLVLGAAIRLVAFFLSYMSIRHRDVADDFVQYLRMEQRSRLMRFLRRG